MMSPEIWKKCILESVMAIADKEFQKRTWFGLSKNEISSPEEVFCKLFDDNDFANFLLSKKIGLTQEQRDAGIYLQKKMDEYPDPEENFYDPHKMISDPKWEEIRVAAKSFLNMFSVN